MNILATTGKLSDSVSVRWAPTAVLVSGAIPSAPVPWLARLVSNCGHDALLIALDHDDVIRKPLKHQPEGATSTSFGGHWRKRCPFVFKQIKGSLNSSGKFRPKPEALTLIPDSCCTGFRCSSLQDPDAAHQSLVSLDCILC